MAKEESGIGETIQKLDPKLGGLAWYLKPGLDLLSRQGEENPPRIIGVLDTKFPPTIASTSELRRIQTDNGALIVKEMIPGRSFYTDSSTAQALQLAGEQAIGRLQLEGSGMRGDSIYKGIYRMEIDDFEGVTLAPYRLGDEGRVVSVMAELDVDRTLALAMFDDVGLTEEQLSQAVITMVNMAMSVQLPIPEEEQERAGSVEFITSRVEKHTPGRLARGEIVLAEEYTDTQRAANEYVQYALKILELDPELQAYLTSEVYCRRGGDVRAANVFLGEGNEVAAVIDQISLLLDPTKWGLADVSHAPWGMNSATYEVAFMIPDFLKLESEEAVQTVVDAMSAYDGKFQGASWGDLGSVAIRALRFWTAMKAVEMAGFSSFALDKVDEDGREWKYLDMVIREYAGIGVELLKPMWEYLQNEQ